MDSPDVSIVDLLVIGGARMSIVKNGNTAATMKTDVLNHVLLQQQKTLEQIITSICSHFFHELPRIGIPMKIGS